MCQMQLQWYLENSYIALDVYIRKEQDLKVNKPKSQLNNEKEKKKK